VAWQLTPEVELDVGVNLGQPTVIVTSLLFDAAYPLPPAKEA
jgi:hypothetical protein